MPFSAILSRPIVLAGVGLGALIGIALTYFVAAFLLTLFPFSSESTSLPNVQIVLDRSMAMEGPFGDGTKMEAAIQAVDDKILISQAARSSNLALRQYGGPCAGNNTSLLVGFGPENQQNIRRALQDIKVDGETTFVDGVIQAIRDSSQARGAPGLHKEVIVIAGRGDSCQLEGSASRVRQEMDRTGVRVSFHFIGLDVPLEEQDHINEIALAISGKLPTYITTPIELDEILTELISTLEDTIGPPSPTNAPAIVPEPTSSPEGERDGSGSGDRGILEGLWKTAEEHYNAAVELQRQGHLEEAIVEYGEAIRIDPQYVLAYNNRGAAYIDLGQYQQAVADLEVVISLDPENALAHYNLGRAYFLLGQLERAVESFSEVIRIDPQYVLAYNNRGVAYTDLGQYQQAMADLEVVISLEPENALAHYNLGRVHFLLGQIEQEADAHLEQAVAGYTEAIRLDPRYGQAYGARAMAYTLLGDNGAAQQDIDQAVGLGVDGDSLERTIEQLKERR